MPLTLPIENIIPSVEKGCLYIVATPIGNFNDITLRAAAILMGVDLIAAEDTRSTACLLSHYGIKTRLISCHEHNEIQRIPKLIDLLKENQTIALVSDAGTPTVSDPGYRLVSKAAAEGIKIVPVPGACAAVAALSVSGLPTDSYTFIGFPARKTAKLTRQLEALAKEPRTIIFYESPRRLLDLIDALIETMGDRQAVLTRELTKLYEEIVRGALSDIRSQLLKKKEIKGECTLLIQGAEKRPAISWDKISTEIQNLL
ncbi:MAG: 16S rRNA (cytidine(1402)-2'-O)-methyltransferase, partial [Desulfobacteraceae bacterium]